jgi:Flp pilus assembly pilin Flp
MRVKVHRTTLRPRSIRQHAIRLWQETSGATAMEYGLIAALIAVAILASLRALGATLIGLPLQSIVDAIQAILS